ncbi:MAG: S-layer homology domain-containing protein [Erysipelotrichaceae bacterium]|nr:S-layer homology domain-containing protein [Erysipelotrichaceae bacterium]
MTKILSKKISRIIMVLAIILVQLCPVSIKAEDKDVLPVTEDQSIEVAVTNGEKAATTVTAGVPFAVQIINGGEVSFKFKPTETGYYYFTVKAVRQTTESYGDWVYYLFNNTASGGFWVSEMYNEGQTINMELQAGTTYTFKLYGESEGTIDFDLQIDKRPFDILGVSAEDQTIYLGSEVDTWDFEYDPETGTWSVENNFYYRYDWLTITTDGFSGTPDQIENYYDYNLNIIWTGPSSMTVGTHTVTANVEGNEVSFNVTVLASPITSVTVDQAFAYEMALYCNTQEYTYWDENTQSYANYTAYKYYNTKPQSLTVVAGGVTYSGDLEEVREELYDVYGCWFNCCMVPRTTALKLGRNKVEWSFGGKKKTGYLTVKESPIISIEKPDDITKYKDDYDNYLYLYEGIKVYDYTPESITVVTADGTISGPIYEVNSELYDAYGLYMDWYPDVDPYSVEWQPGETHVVTVCCGNIETSYNVTISNLAYITKVTISNITREESDICTAFDWQYNPETDQYENMGEYQYYDPAPINMTVKTRTGTYSGTWRDVYELLVENSGSENFYLDYDDAIEEQAQNGAWAVNTTHTVNYTLGDIHGTYTVSIVPNTKPYIVSSSSAIAGITVSWTAWENADKYYLYRRAYNGSIWEPFDESLWGDWERVTTTSKTQYTDKVGKTMGTLYVYRVRAHMTNGTLSKYSDNWTVVYNPFDDVPVEWPYFMYTSWAYNNDIVGGSHTSSGDFFKPENPCTRAQFCIMLYKMVGKPPVEYDEQNLPFNDIASQSSNTKQAIIWCYQQGLVNGKNGKFSPKGNITRAQLLIMLYKLAGQPSVGTQTCPFEDIAGETSNTRKAIIWAYNKGMISSLEGDEFGPSEMGTRLLLTEMLFGYANN